MNLHDNGYILCQHTPLEALELHTKYLNDLYKYFEQLEHLDPSKITEAHQEQFFKSWNAAKEISQLVFSVDPKTIFNPNK